MGIIAYSVAVIKIKKLKGKQLKMYRIKIRPSFKVTEQLVAGYSCI